MKLYTGMGPNPRVVTIAISELGADVEQVAVDLMAGENRDDEHLKRNPAGQLPTLETDDGSFISEITAIVVRLERRQLSGGVPLEVFAGSVLARHEVDGDLLDVCAEFGDRDRDDARVGTHAGVELHCGDSFESGGAAAGHAIPGGGAGPTTHPSRATARAEHRPAKRRRQSGSRRSSATPDPGQGARKTS